MERIFSEKAKSAIESAEKSMVYVGLGLLLVSPFVPALIPLASEIIIGGGTSLGVTRGVSLRKHS